MEELRISSADPRGSPATEQQAAGVGILLQIMMLVLSFVIGHVLRRHRFYYLPEASASLLIGLIVGVLANVSNTENSIRSWFNFHEEFFFFSSVGFKRSVFVSLTWFRVYSVRIQSSAWVELQLLSANTSKYEPFVSFLNPNLRMTSVTNLILQKPFFSNFGAIVTFAIFGTFVASMVTGILVYLAGVSYLIYRLPFVECLMFGALISATDPVTVLSIFQELGTDVNLYALVFGESVLNDAMAISLYRTMSSVRSHMSSDQNLFMVVVRFLETFVGSMSAELRQMKVITCPYKLKGWSWIYFCFDILPLSSLLSFLPKYYFSGFVAYNTLCGALTSSTFSSMLVWISIIFRTWSAAYLFFFHIFRKNFEYMLAEGLGLSGIVSILFTGIVMKHYTFSNLSDKSQKFVAAFFHLISSLAETFIFIYMGFDIAMEQHSWAANVFSCAYLVNMARPSHRKISMKHQKALWYSGLRGAMAFALALQSVHDLPEGDGQTIFTATTSIVVLTVLLIGGSTGTMLEALEVVGDGHEIPLGESFDAHNGYIAPTYVGESSSGNRFKMKLSEFRKSTASFTELDKNYLTPFFTTQSGEDDEHVATAIAFFQRKANILLLCATMHAENFTGLCDLPLMMIYLAITEEEVMIDRHESSSMTELTLTVVYPVVARQAGYKTAQ
ncbi:hypothetical protein SASPL_123824 [Salvia splendens]|uniref:Cation/H+ exchanger transmembrane domain-containing protein n=1 Tax=Salvia splendens TaxID=180675 RepID=A0A8X8XPU4_SALSN|nr:hypothetical protein SASPL_123824 [Salvia splendens]